MNDGLVAKLALEAVLETELAPRPGWDDVQVFAAEYQRKKVFSKFSTGTISTAAGERALEKFLTHCLFVKNFNRWRSPSSKWETDIVTRFAYRCRIFFNELDIDLFSPTSLHERGGVGPGASLKAFGTDFLRKMYYGPTSATSVSVLHDYIRGCKGNPTDFAAALRGLKVFGCHYSDCSRTSFVEKNVDEARTIATEPSVNMFYQLAFGSIFNLRLKQCYGWDVSTQPFVNRNMAREGSVSGVYSTVDLTSASDSVSLQLVKDFLPGWLFELLEHYRCPFTVLPNGRKIRLPMVSTMGNGWTFSLMTAILYCLLHAVCDVSGRSGDVRKISVFGDDIVVPCHLTEHSLEALRLFGFLPNSGKTFSTGPFRESCGHDFFRGRFVRPVFVRRLGTDDSFYVAFNRFAEWSALHDIPVPRVLKTLRRHGGNLLVPLSDDMASGVRVPSIVGPAVGKYGSWRYKRLEFVPFSYSADEVPTRMGRADHSVNPDGLHVAMLGGYLRNGKISTRSEKSGRWRLASRTSINWNYRTSLPAPGWGEAEERRWKALLVSVID